MGRWLEEKLNLMHACLFVAMKQISLWTLAIRAQVTSPLLWDGDMGQLGGIYWELL
jgi:hypothetical protein